MNPLSVKFHSYTCEDLGHKQMKVTNLNDKKQQIISSRSDLMKFREEALKSSNQSYSSKEWKLLEEDLNEIGKLYVDVISKPPMEMEKPSKVPPKESYTGYVQILSGKDSYYVGALVPEGLKEESLKLASKELEGMEIQPEKESHVTVISPHKEISLKSTINDSDFKPIELNFNVLTIGLKGHVNLNSAPNEEVKKSYNDIADLVKAPYNTRNPHAIIGRLSEKDTEQVFSKPNKYGFELDESGLFVHKTIDSSLKMTIKGTQEGKFADEQLILKKQRDGSPGITEEEKKRSKELFENRKRQVEQQQKEIRELTFSKKKDPNLTDFVKKAPYTPEKLDLALVGNKEYGRVPLTFSVRENGLKLWQEFKKDVEGLLKKHDIKDAKVQILGSGVHGFSRNPKKEAKNWSPNSDTDLAIFSKTLSLKAIEQNVQVNKVIVLDGEFTCYKNERDPLREGIGWHDTEIGKDFSELEERMSVQMYGEIRDPGTDLDFKLNIGYEPFSDAIDVI